MKELVETLLEKLKKVKLIETNENDDVLSFALETTIQHILNYCNFGIEDWPEALNNTAIFMTVDVLNDIGMTFGQDGLEGDTKSMTEGDFSITKETKAEIYQKLMTTKNFIRNYETTLNQFRKVKW